VVCQIEITVGKVLGKGGFCTVSEVSGVECTLTDKEKAEEGFQKTYIGLQNKKYIKDRHDRLGHARYAIKKVTAGSFEKGDPHFFVSSIVDLAMEVNFLAVLRHTHIIKMRALTDVPRTSADFFIVMDRLPDTLDRRIEVWTKKNKRSMTKKNIKEEMFYDRLSIAYDICSALLFLHRNNVVYRDLVSKLYMINAIRGVHVLFSLQIITLLNTCSHHF
jgi:serine/threonine protein kinase